MPKFLKFKCGFLAEIGRYLAGKVADRVRSSQNSGQNFFHHQISKIRDFIQESRTPPPRFSRKTGGGGRQLYTTYPRYHLSWKGFTVVFEKNVFFEKNNCFFKFSQKNFLLKDVVQNNLIKCFYFRFWFKNVFFLGKI